MDSGIKRFKDVLNQYNIIPAYQRNYVWECSENKEIDVFWDDLMSFSRSHNDPNKKISTYLLGPIIIHSKESGENFIVDGQQRITTAVILLSAASQICDELYKDKNGIVTCMDAQNYRNIEIASCIGSISDNPNNDKLKLKVAPKNQDFFRNYIISPAHSWDGALTPATKNMKAAYGFFIKKLNNEINKASDNPQGKFKKLEEIINLLLDKCEVFYVDRKTFADAYSVFETINARGKTLTQADLFKNYAFSKCNPEGDTNHLVEQTWLKLESKIEPKKLTDYIRYFWISKRPTVSIHNVFKTISHELTNENEISEFIRNLDTYANYYSFMIDPLNKPSPFSKSPKITECITNLYSLGFSIYAPVLFAMLRSDYNDNDILKVLLKIECYAFRATRVCKKRTGPFWNMIVPQANGISDNKTPHDVCIREILDKIDKELPDDEEFEKSLHKYRFNRNDIARLVLKRLVNNNEFAVRDDMTLEHVLPERPNFENKEWLEYKDTYKDYVYLIGNMTLLTKEDNLGNSNYEYSVKRPIYRKSSLEMNRKLAEYEQWSPDDILDRNEELILEIIYKFRKEHKDNKIYRMANLDKFKAI